jgi:hypothetical protein
MKLIITLTAALALTACGDIDPKEQAKRDAANNRILATHRLVDVVKETLRDPSSMEVDKRGYNLTNDAVCLKYRARNGFGGMNVAYAIYHDGKIHQTASGWDRFCTGNMEMW